MGEMSEMMLGISASDLFCRDLGHAMRGEPLEDDPDDPKYLPTFDGKTYGSSNYTALKTASAYELPDEAPVKKARKKTITATSSEGGKPMNIYESITKIMGELGAVGKTSKNQSQGFMYRGIDAVMNALNPLLAKYKVFVVPEVLEHSREERTNSNNKNVIYSIATVKYTFYAEDGSNVSAVIVGEGCDYGDKSMNKALAIAMKYAFFQVFCIPTEEMVDPDAECHEVKAKTIDALKAKAIEDKAAELGIPVANICKAYKVGSLFDLTVEQFAKIQSNWTQIKEWSDKQ